jgi:type III restriction enzyme
VTAAPSAFALFSFQDQAVQDLQGAALAWAETAAEHNPPQYGSQRIPFLGQLRAVTGAGKTPILASVVGGLGHAVILWTSRSSAVVDQTFNNLRGKYAALLGANTVRVLRQIPSRTDWSSLIEDRTGLTIWVVTTGSWNEAESAAAGGAADARLNMHRPQPDWAGSVSPWEQLRTELRRPLWVVSDESHNQSETQLDQLAGLRPVGFFTASATPVQNELFRKWQAILQDDPLWRDRAAAAMVRVRTRDVVEAELLKDTLAIIDLNSGTEESLDVALDAHRTVELAVDIENVPVEPRAIYVVERSNPPRNSTEEARPVVIWRHLVSRGVAPENIAVYTDTRDLPEGAEQVNSLSRLLPRHRHIIFNQSLQEGWDDPEAYVCYFDGTTRSFTRIRQIVGRVLRQPRAQRFVTEELNTATLVLSCPSTTYETVLKDLKAELRLYAPEDEPDAVPVRLITRSDPLPAIAVRHAAEHLVLPRWTLNAPSMQTPERQIRSRGGSPWAADALEAGGLGRKSVLELSAEADPRVEYLQVLRSARTQNGVYFRRRLGSLNRSALNAIHPDAMSGPAFGQVSCHGSVAQSDLRDLADRVADYFEDRVTFQQDPDPEQASWQLAPYRPRGRELVDFHRSAHAQYDRRGFNRDEMPMAEALDRADGIWLRNPPSSDQGYHLPLPSKTGESSRFFPDFLWWVAGGTWAIETSGRHLLNEKVRGKLITLAEPRVAFVVRGDVTVDGTRQGGEGWTLVVGRAGMSPLRATVADIDEALTTLLGVR